MVAIQKFSPDWHSMCYVISLAEAHLRANSDRRFTTDTFNDSILTPEQLAKVIQSLRDKDIISKVGYVYDSNKALAQIAVVLGGKPLRLSKSGDLIIKDLWIERYSRGAVTHFVVAGMIPGLKEVYHFDPLGTSLTRTRGVLTSVRNLCFVKQ